MLNKRNLISITAGTVFLFIFNVTTVLATDAAAKESGQTAGHGDMKSGGHHCPHKMSSADLDKDGKISKEEFMKHHETMFDKKDANKDGFLDDAEMHRMKKNHMHKYDDQQKNGGHAHDDAKK